MNFFNFSGFSQSMSTINIFNFPSGKKPDFKNRNAEVIIETERGQEIVRYNDFKTLYGYSGLKLINSMNYDLTVYLLIEKETIGSAWNLVAPVILENSTMKITQFNLGAFALQGSGGGLSNTSSLFHKLRDYEMRGYKVSVVPKLVDSEILSNFQFADSGLRLMDLIEHPKTIDLANYRKDQFAEIHETYVELTEDYGL
ncbi:hypothetical protein [Maribacter sp. 2308TA10-17]|uniref:hypothetical protein n=1 Tax=Maribacter sp. 2308TA10-17 TaxID=3386276 RepID=UPI0039BCB664